MALQQHRGRLMTIEELLTVQRQSGPARCAHCDRAGHHELADAALRARIRALEDRIAELEAWMCGVS